MIDTGDTVRVASGPNEGRRGRVVLIRNPEDILEIGDRRLTGLLEESYALVEFRDLDAGDQPYTAQISVPVRRLEKTR